MGNESAYPERSRRKYYSAEGLPKNDKLRPSSINNQRQSEGKNKHAQVGKSFQESKIQVDQSDDSSEEVVENRRQSPKSRKAYQSAVYDASKERKLKQLTTKNDDLRKQLIRISTELTMKLKKKKYEQKTKIEYDGSFGSQKARQSLKKELQNAYKQINMYKKTLEDIKLADLSEESDLKITGLENKIAERDIQIELCLYELQAVKAVTSHQTTAIKKDESSQAVINSLKQQLQTLRTRIRKINKEDREREKKYMEQHSYMMALQYKSRQLNGDNMPSTNTKVQTEKQKITTKQFEEADEELKDLRVKHDEYHKRINNLVNMNKNIKEENRDQRNILKERTKELQNIRYKRDAFVKKIKDNLDAFISKESYDEEKQPELSEFESSNQDPNVIMEEDGERGTFDIEHLKSEQKVQGQQPKNKHNYEDTQSKQQPKKWKKMVTRVVSKGSQMPQEKEFKSGITKPKRDMKIIMMNVWMNKKKQVTAIQPVYLLDGIITEGKKSSRNHEDEYRVSYQLEEFDYLKSILGIFGKTGFLEYLVLQSHFGKVSKIGRERTQGTNFAIGVAKEETPIQIVGASTLDGLYWRINRLEVQVLVDLQGSK